MKDDYYPPVDDVDSNEKGEPDDEVREAFAEKEEE